MKSDEVPGADFTDEDLAEWVQAGEVGFWPSLAERVLGVIQPIVRRRVWNSHDQEDVEQDCFIRFFKAFPGYSSSKGQLRTYVAVITGRQIQDYLRAIGKEPAFEDTEVLLNVSEDLAAHSNPDADLVAFLNERVGEVASKAVQMRVFDGYSYAEIADGLGKTEAAAKMMVGRALKKLRNHVEGRDA